MQELDAVVIGAGAAGMMCAGVAAQRGARVVLVEHRNNPGEKIRISGGGRCNFTNVDTGPGNFVSENPHFCRSALAGYSPADFLALVRRHRIAFHEKHRGQLFCDGSATQIVDMLKAECDVGGVEWRFDTRVRDVRADAGRFAVETDAGEIHARNLVVATGGLSIPKAGATDFAYRLARRFGLRVVEPRPGLVPLVFEPPDWASMADLAGVALEARVRCEGPFGIGIFKEDLLFTHRGLSGPAGLQISNYWQPGAALAIDLTPDVDWSSEIRGKGSRKGSAANVLSAWMPRRLAERVVAGALPAVLRERSFADLSDKSLDTLARAARSWRVVPCGTEGFRKAEVTLGGVDTRDLSSRSFEARGLPGLYFIGEAVDVTGWLGGYNFQWAWSSAVACARALTESR